MRIRSQLVPNLFDIVYWSTFVQGLTFPRQARNHVAGYSGSKLMHSLTEARALQALPTSTICSGWYISDRYLRSLDSSASYLSCRLRRPLTLFHQTYVAEAFYCRQKIDYLFKLLLPHCRRTQKNGVISLSRSSCNVHCGSFAFATSHGRDMGCSAQRETF